VPPVVTAASAIAKHGVFTFCDASLMKILKEIFFASFRNSFSTTAGIEHYRSTIAAGDGVRGELA
jgi:hypothetical protein